MFFSFLQRYLTSHQQEVTIILTYLIQSCHPLVPPEDLVPVIKAIAFNFISDRCTDEVITVGLNSVSEIIKRIPSILREEGMDDMINDFAQYGKKCHKSVMMASHNLINIVREFYPTLLHKSKRGKYYNVNNFPTRYGDVIVKKHVDGVELLEAYERGDIVVDEEGDVHYKDDEDDVVDQDVVDQDESDEDSDEAPELIDLRDYDVVEEYDQEEGDDDDDDDQDDEQQEDDQEDDQEDGDDDQEDDESEEEQEDDEDDEMEEQQQDDDDQEDDDNVPLVVENDNKKDNKKRKSLDSHRILTSEDFSLLEKLKSAQREREKDPKFRKKRKLSTSLSTSMNEDDDDDDQQDPLSYSVHPDSIKPTTKTHKSNKIERLQRILEGRKEHRFEHEGHKGGLTNKEKQRKQNYLMVRKGKYDQHRTIIASCCNSSCCCLGKANISQKGRMKSSQVRAQKLSQRKQQGRDKRKRRRT